MIALRIEKAIKNYLSNAKKKDLVNHSSVIIGEKFHFDFNKNIFDFREGGKVEIKNNVIFRDYCSVMVHDMASLFLGNDVFFNRYCSVNCLGKITIGNYTIFGEGVRIYDHNHIHKGQLGKILQLTGCNVGTISIGENSWIGANVTILNNVKIGNNVIVGAGNLIYKDIPDNKIVMSKVDYVLKDRT